MVCANCAKKQAKSSLATSDPILNKNQSSIGGGPSGSTSSQRKTAENKLLSSKNRYAPYAPASTRRGAVGTGSSSTNSKCEVCKNNITVGRKLCQTCSYKKAACAICGVKIMDTKGYKMTNK